MPSPNKFIRRGYFPKEIPPSFKTASLAKALNPAATGFPFVDAAQTLKWTWLDTHSLGRASIVRRTLGIPNPMNHWALAKESADNWTSIRAHIRRSTLSLSVPTLRVTQGRAAVPAVPLSDVMLSATKKITRRQLLTMASSSSVTACIASTFFDAVIRRSTSVKPTTSTTALSGTRTGERAHTRRRVGL